MATLVTTVPSFVANFHRPARFRPQNHVLANLSPLCPVITLSHPVVLLDVASSLFLLLVSFVQMAFVPGIVPMPPSLFRQHAMHVISGALRSSKVVPLV